jgi:two-component system response regulator FixJ
MSAEPTVFVVDDDQPVRKSLDMLIRSVGLPVETFGSAQEFLDRYTPDRPGCLVLDVRMPRMSGLELQEHFNAQGVHIPIIFVSGHGDVPIAVRAIKNGAVQFLEKPFSKQLLLEFIHEALNRDQRVRQSEAAQTEVQARIAQLTDRERQVMERVVAGKVSKEVAAELGISKKTVDVHRARVMNKLQVESVAELVELVLRARPMQAAETI